MMHFKLSLYKKVLILLSLPVVAHVALYMWYGRLVDRAAELERQQSRSKEVIGHVNWMSNGISSAVAGKAGLLSAGGKEYAWELSDGLRTMRNELPVLQQLFEKDADQSKRVERLRSLVNAAETVLSEPDSNKVETSKSYVETSEPAASKQDSDRPDSRRLNSNKVAVERLSYVMNQPQVRELTAEWPKLRHALLATEIEQERVTPEALPRVRARVRQIIDISIAIDLLIAVSLMYLFTRNIGSRLSVISENLIRLARRKPLQARIGGTDEIAEFDDLFHSVAATLDEMTRRERAIVDNAVEVICSLDDNGHIIEVNPACTLAWGYEPANLFGSRLTKLASDESRDLMTQKLSEARRTLIPVHFESTIVKQTGESVNLIWSCTWSEEHKMMFCIAHDISERKRIEQMKEQFFQMVSHDIRAPLTGIGLFLELFLNNSYGKINSKGEKAGSASLRSLRHINAMIDDLLAIERLSSGKIELNNAEIDVDKVVAAAIETVQNAANRKSVRIDWSKIECRIFADEKRLLQVLVNLLSNAVKFSPPDACIIIGAALNNDILDISVTDSGPGVPAEFHEKIFDRFQQAHASDAERGTGLGLAICKAIIAQMHGTIGVKSEPGQGSTFCIKLPVAPSEGTEDEAGELPDSSVMNSELPASSY